MQSLQTNTFASIFFLLSNFLLLISPNKLLATATPITHRTFTNETDRQALLAIKDQINVDPFQVLDSWNASVHFCRWQGVNCSRMHQRVTSLNLSSLHLAGTLSPHIGNLSFLGVIDIGDNNFHGIIPQEIGRLPRLRKLFLWNNSFEGDVPPNLSHCSKLEFLVLNSNDLVGTIAAEFGSFPKLTELSLSANQFTGSIPPSLGNLSFLTVLGLARNNLEGSIPYDLTRLGNIQFLQLAINKFSGKVPIGLYNISSLYMLSITDNKLHGELPPDLGLTLPNLQRIHVGGNNFSGPIPKSLANASALTFFSIPNNHFTGPLPMELGTLQYLDTLKLSFNPVFSASKNDDNLRFFRSLTNCTNLMYLQASQTNLTGAFPDSVANLSTKLTYLMLDQNSLSGNLPQGMEYLVNLVFLALDDNNLSGTLSDSMGRLMKLQSLGISKNKLWGEIPASIGNVSSLTILDLSDNKLEGKIPASLGNCRFLQVLALSSNNLTGVIPEQVIGLSSLSTLLDLSRNNLNGTLSPQVGNLKNLHAMNISENELSGEIPITLGSCLFLEYLHLGNNRFDGTIPSSLQNLKTLQVLDLSRNNLFGKIPEFLGNFSNLTTLNLSFNDFAGQVPEKGVFLKFGAFSIAGNKKLCGGIQQLQLPSCPTSVSNSHRNHIVLIEIILPVIGGVACIFLVSAFMYWRRQRKQDFPPPGMPVLNPFMDLSYEQLLQATDGFSSRNLIGKGSFGSVYKGLLNSGEELIAVKVFNLDVQGSNKSFLAECGALKNIRHRNLVKIISCCSSIDFKGQDFKALVYEFMPNGNLDSWLHPGSIFGPKFSHSLSLGERINIAVDLANAVEYLHHHCKEPVVHCDLKPSNVLLDSDLTAHVGDFGLARLLLDTTSASSQSETSSIWIRGTIGYVAPEYGMNKKVSTEGDVYSYGIILLELFTGKRPSDGTFNDSLSLRGFVEMALLNDEVMQVIDPRLIPSEAGQEQERISSSAFGAGSSSDQKIKKFLKAVLRIGVTCSTESPRERMDIRDVLKELHAAKRMLAL